MAPTDEPTRKALIYGFASKSEREQGVSHGGFESMTLSLERTAVERSGLLRSTS